MKFTEYSLKEYFKGNLHHQMHTLEKKKGLIGNQGEKKLNPKQAETSK